MTEVYQAELRFELNTHGFLWLHKNTYIWDHYISFSGFWDQSLLLTLRLNLFYVGNIFYLLNISFFLLAKVNSKNKFIVENCSFENEGLLKQGHTTCQFQCWHWCQHRNSVTECSTCTVIFKGSILLSYNELGFHRPKMENFNQ